MALEIYAYQGVRSLTDNLLIKSLYWVITAVSYIVVLYALKVDGKPSQRLINLAITLFLSFIVTKILLIFSLLIDDVIRLGRFAFAKFSSDETAAYPVRQRFLSVLGWGLTGIFAGLFLDGVLFGRFRHKVRTVRLKFDNLPEAFQGYRVIQISDLHSGSFPDAEKLRFTVDLVNKQNADLVLFTGDAVNNYAWEFEQFIPLFRDMKGKDGKFCVLGNHDYGFYGQFDSEAQRQNNVPALIQHFRKAGFLMLRNEHVTLTKNGQQIHLVGVDNWGKPPFPQFGDLDKATAGLDEKSFKLLMSHDPSHFDFKVVGHPSNINLTMSGHTHGMQFGLDLKNLRWSPVEYRYPKWIDLYRVGRQMLYVNRGYGVLAYPGRVGIDPEITLFELSRA